MKRLVFILFIALSSVMSYAQTPLGRDVDVTLDLFHCQQRPHDAFEYWNNKEELHRTDSLYSWANAFLGQNFMYDLHLKEADILINRAWESINDIKSDDQWWWEQRGYVATRKAMLYSYYLHDYDQGHFYAVEAKIAHEVALSRGINYARALIVLAETSMKRGEYILARTFAGQALAIATLQYNDSVDEETLQNFLYIFRQSASIEYQLGYYQNTINSCTALRNICQDHGVEPTHVDLMLGSAYIMSEEYEKAIDCLYPYYEQSDVPEFKIESGVALLFAKYKLGHNDIYQLTYDIAKLQIDKTSKMFSFMSDKEREQWWMSNYENAIIPLIDLLLIKSGSKNINGLVANNEIFTNGLLLRASNQLKETVLKSNDTIVIDKYHFLEELKSQWSITTDKNEKDQLESQISTLEKELLSNLNIDINSVSSWQDIASSLSDNEAAIEFVRFDNYETNDAEYYAIIIRYACKEPCIIQLFDESLLEIILENQTTQPIKKYINELYLTDSPRCKGDKLYELIWSGIEKEVKGCTTLYYSPSGLLNTISLQALYVGKCHLGEKYNMHLVSSVGVIPHIKESSSPTMNSAVIYGGIQYDVDESMMIQTSRAYVSTNITPWDYGFGETRRGWRYLPGTEKEAKSISSMFMSHNIDVTLISGINANEESFKALSDSGINTIHIATHGFFLSDNSELKKNAFINPTMLDNIGYIDPMMRSGLLFAGGNRVWTGKRHIEGAEDGVLTAQEIAAMDLSSVDLLVLSACQTGLGDVVANEGVYGLQRAFKLAGVQTIIMSLWEVDDRATSIMMSVFYEKYLEGNSKDDAFKYAIDAVRNYEVDGKQPFNYPYYWAGFVMMD